MQGSKKIIDALNTLLTAEMTSVDQYFIHSEMYSNWGFHKLYERLHHERDEEMAHAKMLIERILFLDGVPDIAPRGKLRIGKDVPGMLANDLETEYEVGAALRKAIALAEKEHDYITRSILTKLLDDTELDHTHWLEKQLNLIKAMGLGNYLQSQAS